DTSQRLFAIPAPEQTLENPAWVKFLLYDNQGQIRLALRSFIPDDRHAQVIVRLKGNQSIDDEGAAAVAAKKEAEQMKLANASKRRSSSGGPTIRSRRPRGTWARRCWS